jgi:hypothetical protein
MIALLCEEGPDIQDRMDRVERALDRAADGIPSCNAC